MPYADTDFFIALIKENDRFSTSAHKLYSEYKGNISTSLATVLELLILGKRLNIPAEKLVANILAIAKVNDISSVKILFATHLIEEKKVSIFDAFHAALCDGQIISSDHIYDKIGIKRIKLESSQSD